MNEQDVEGIRANVDLIRRMVDQSRQVRAQTGHIYLWVGILFLIAALVDVLVPGSLSWVGWPSAGVLSLGYAVWAGRRQAHGQGHLGYAPQVEGVAWTISSVIIGAYIGLSFVVEGGLPRLMFPLISLMVAIPLTVSSALYRHWPLAAGAAVFVLVGVITAFMGDLGQRLGFSLAMLLGYVLPGVAMMKQTRDPPS